MEAITFSEYWAQVEAIAVKITAEGGDLYALHEAIDQHEFIIYTNKALAVLVHTRNEDAYFEDFGPLEATDFSTTIVKFAFAAMLQDVLEHDKFGAEQVWEKSE